jgi:integrase
MGYRLVHWNKEFEESATFSVDRRARRRPGLPTVFDEDQRPVRVLNRWLNHLGVTSNSPDTWGTYAPEVVRFGRFLEEQFQLSLVDRALLECGDEVMRAYYLRCVAPEVEDLGAKPIGDTTSTLGKRRAALMSFYRWVARPGGELPCIPFQVVTVRTRWGETTTLAGLRGGRRSIDRRNPVPGTQIDRFFNVGILGQLPDGSPDPSFRRIATCMRTAAGFSLAVGAGLRHSEILSFTTFELPPAHPDGLTPLAVADKTAKGDVGRKVIAFSRWLSVVHQYVANERAMISSRAAWRPRNALEVDPAHTSRVRVTYASPSGRQVTRLWRDVDRDERQRLVVPGHGSPLVMLDSRASDGRPITGEDALDEALQFAGTRCCGHWPAEDWTFQVHSGRHTFATELLRFLNEAESHADEFRMVHGRDPVWLSMARRDDPRLLTADSMGHTSFDTTMIYAATALWDALLAANADPSLNPALDEEVM